MGLYDIVDGPRVRSASHTKFEIILLNDGGKMIKTAKVLIYGDL